jgi:hypothetical protein
MTVLHSGTTTKYSANWNQVFKKTKPAIAAKSQGKKAAAKKSAKAKR